MFAALSWYHEDTQGTTPRRRHGFPSWTWAGWAGPIRRMCYGFRVRVHKQHDHSLKLRVRGLLMESANGDMSPAAVYLELKEPISSCPGSAVAIRFEALAIPSTSFFFRRRTWQLGHHAGVREKHLSGNDPANRNTRRVHPTLK